MIIYSCQKPVARLQPIYISI